MLYQKIVTLKISRSARPLCRYFWIFVLAGCFATVARAEAPGHNTFSSFYREPDGAVSSAIGMVRIRLVTEESGAPATERVQLRLYDQRSRREQWIDMSLEASAADRRTWVTALPIPPQGTMLNYDFQAFRAGKTRWYVDDEVKIAPGGFGIWLDHPDQSRSFRITVYDKDFEVPAWLQGAVVYQIFPDRFRNGDTGNDPADGSGWIYGRAARFVPWAQPLCDPLGPGGCKDDAATQFYGGDLAGITQNLDSLKELGVDVLYLNPIFQSPTNHRYDTQDFLKIDPVLGDDAAFDRLVSAAHARGMRIVLDAVFNHASSDSRYFDYYDRWSATGQLVAAAGPGTNDGSGACESAASPYRGWFTLPARKSAAGSYDGGILTCPRKSRGGTGMTWESWAGRSHMAKFDSRSPGVRRFFFGADDGSAVGPYWARRGVDGWRLDVGFEVDGGPLTDPDNGFWSGFRAATRRIRPDTALIGEQWGRATPWLLGQEWDSSMNYPLRSILLDWMFDSCRGLGCESGRIFRDDDSNDGSVLGSIKPNRESRIVDRLASLRQDTPPAAALAMMNLLGSHDTSRILFLLKKVSADSQEQARRKLRFLGLFLFTYPGAPTIYYGDEVALRPDDTWSGQVWQDDPNNRAAYPWADQGLHPDQALRADFARLARLHHERPELERGTITDVVFDDARRLLGFCRSAGADRSWVVFNRATDSQNIGLVPQAFDCLGKAGSYRDLLNQKTVPVQKDGAVTLPEVPGLWGAILSR